MRRFLLGCLVLGLMAVVPLRADEKEELKKLQGTWEMVSIVENGKQVPADKVKDAKMIISEDKVKMVKAAEKEFVVGFKVDSSKTPKAIDFTTTNPQTQKEQTFFRGIYQLDGKTLQLCLLNYVHKDRPTAFESKKGSHVTLMTLKRGKP